MMKIFLATLIHLVLGCGILFAQDSYNTEIYSGNRNFDKKNYDAASSHYLKAIQQKNNDFGAHYNLGNALYKLKKYDEAKAEYEKAANFTKNNLEKAAAQYNIGNSFMQKKDHEKAAEFYKKALKLDPNNESIRKNYQIAKLKEKQEQNNQKKNDGQNEKEKGDAQKSGDENNKSQQNQGNAQNQQGTGVGNQQSQNQQNQGEKIPKDLEEAILRNSANKEKETARRILNKKGYYVPQSNEKDW